MFKRVIDSSDASSILHTDTMSPKERRKNRESKRKGKQKEEMKERRKKGRSGRS